MLTILVVFKVFISDMSLCKISDDLGGAIFDPRATVLTILVVVH